MHLFNKFRIINQMKLLHYKHLFNKNIRIILYLEEQCSNYIAQILNFSQNYLI